MDRPDARALSRPPARPAAIWLTSTLVPAGFIAALIAFNCVDMPFWDDWYLTSQTLLKWREGTLGAGELAAPLNESRPVVPRLLFLALGIASDGRIPLQLAITFALACIVSWNLVQLAVRTVGGGPRVVWATSFLANLLVFTPKQAENWLWGAQVVCLLPAACVTGTLVVLGSGSRSAARLAYGAVLCTVATWSYSNGLLTWIVTAPAVALLLGPRPLLAWIGGFAVNAGLYFHGVTRPAFPAPRPLLLLDYLAVFLGGSLGADRLWLTRLVGAVLLLGFLFLAGYFLRFFRDVDLRTRMLVWLCLGAYSTLSGALAGLGRSRYGVQQALSNRYVTFSLYLPVAAIFLVAIVSAHARRGTLLASRPRLGRVAIATLAGGFLLLHAVSFTYGVNGTVWVGRMLRYGKSCMLFVDSVRDERCLTSWVLPSSDTVHSFATGLDRFGYLHPGLLRTHRLQDPRGEDPEPRGAGVLEGFGDTGTTRWASGWAVLPGSGRIADAVILALQAPNGDWIPWRFQAVLMPRADVAERRGWAYRNAGWAHPIDERELPPRPFRVSAWAFDAESGRAWKLRNSSLVER